MEGRKGKCVPAFMPKVLSPDCAFDCYHFLWTLSDVWGVGIECGGDGWECVGGVECVGGMCMCVGATWSFLVYGCHWDVCTYVYVCVCSAGSRLTLKNYDGAMSSWKRKV